MILGRFNCNNCKRDLICDLTEHKDCYHGAVTWPNLKD